jgi:hypothetical protein
MHALVSVPVTTRVPYPYPRNGFFPTSSSVGPISATRPDELHEPAMPSCSDTMPPSGKNALWSAPRVPGTAKCVATMSGTSSGHSRRVSGPRSHRNTMPTTISMRMPVRETVESTPTTSAASGMYQRGPATRTT